MLDFMTAGHTFKQKKSFYDCRPYIEKSFYDYRPYI